MSEKATIKRQKKARVTNQPDYFENKRYGANKLIKNTPHLKALINCYFRDKVIRRYKNRQKNMQTTETCKQKTTSEKQIFAETPFLTPH